jgi:hypothetical protein
MDILIKRSIVELIKVDAGNLRFIDRAKAIRRMSLNCQRPRLVIGHDRDQDQDSKEVQYRQD